MSLNNLLPLPTELNNLILYKHGGLSTPTALIINKYIDRFLWMNGDYKTIDEKNKEEEGGGVSYFIWNSFNNFGFN